MALTDNLISAWELNEASGNALDSHGAHTLTDNNTVGSGTGLVYGNARDFEDGSDEFFSASDHADLTVAEQDFTVEAWVKPESQTNFNNAVSKASGSLVEFNITCGVGSVIQMNVFNSSLSGKTATWGSLLTNGNWYQLIGWYDLVADQIGFVVNAGTPVTTSCAGFTIATATGGEWRIGGYRLFGSDRTWDGLIGPVRLWKRVLTSDERTALYNGGNGLAYPFASGQPARKRMGGIKHAAARSMAGVW